LSTKISVLTGHLALAFELLEIFGDREGLKRALNRYELAVAGEMVLALDPNTEIVNNTQAEAARAAIRLLAKRPPVDFSVDPCV